MAEHLTARQRRPSMARRKKRRIGAGVSHCRR